MAEEKDTMARCHHILQLLLVFAERNPGITRILNGDALLGEHDWLRDRISVLFDKLETQIKQVLREKRLREGQGFQLDETMLANLLLAYTEGRISQFVRPSSKSSPLPALKISGSLSAASCCRADKLNLQSVAATPLQTGCSKEGGLGLPCFLWHKRGDEHQMRPGLSHSSVRFMRHKPFIA